MIDIQTIKLIDLIPSNLQSDENIRAAAEAIDRELKTINELIPKLTFLYSIDHLEEKMIDELAWENHLDFYDPTLPIEKKRELVRNALSWHRRKGTSSAVEELIGAVFGSGTVVEWWEYGGDPYHFKIITSDPTATADQATKFIAAINSVKNTRSWLDKIEITTEGTMDLFIGNVLHIGDYITVRQVV